MPHKDQFTKQEDIFIEWMRSEGKLVKEIAKVTERTQLAIHKRLSKLNVKAPNRHRLLAYLPHITKSHTLDDVAKRMGVCRRTVTEAKFKLRNLGYSYLPATRRKRQTLRPKY